MGTTGKLKMSALQAWDWVVREWRRIRKKSWPLFIVSLVVLTPFRLAKELLASVVGALVLTLSALLAGVLGSVYSPQIGTSWPLNLEATTIAPEAERFYLFASIFALLYLSRRIIVDRRIEKKSASLVEVLRTMPPVGTLNRFANLYRLTAPFVQRELRQLVAKKPTSEEALKVAEDRFVDAIREVLRAVLAVAHAMDGQHRARYAINLMLYVKISELSEADLEALGDELIFLPTSTDIRKLDGALRLHTELSVSTDESEKKEDKKLSRIALPVPSQQRNPRGGKFNALPGAPLSFQQSRVMLIEDTAQMASWVERDCDVPPSIVQEVAEYFSSEVSYSIRSVFSAPVESPGSGPVAVLNLHRDEEHLFDNSKERAEQFYALCAPFLTLIGELLDGYSQLEITDKPVKKKETQRAQSSQTTEMVGEAK